MKAPPRAWQARNTNSAGHPRRVHSCPMVSTRLWTASSKIWTMASRTGRSRECHVGSISRGCGPGLTTTDVTSSPSSNAPATPADAGTATDGVSLIGPRFTLRRTPTDAGG